MFDVLLESYFPHMSIEDLKREVLEYEECNKKSVEPLISEETYTSLLSRLDSESPGWRPPRRKSRKKKAPFGALGFLRKLKLEVPKDLIDFAKRPESPTLSDLMDKLESGDLSLGVLEFQDLFLSSGSMAPSVVLPACSIPSLGKVLLRRLDKVFPHFLDLFAASLTEMKAIQGMGETKAENLRMLMDRHSSAFRGLFPEEDFLDLEDEGGFEENDGNPLSDKLLCVLGIKREEHPGFLERLGGIGRLTTRYSQAVDYVIIPSEEYLKTSRSPVAVELRSQTKSGGGVSILTKKEVLETLGAGNLT
jgi:hypothetical protein